MEKGFNLKVYEFKEKLTQMVNEANKELPFSVTLMCFRELLLQLENANNQVIANEKQIYEEHQTKEAEKDVK